jgi:hypothetical protein
VGSPDEPFELDILLILDCQSLVLLHYRLHLHQPIEVEALLEAVLKLVVVALGEEGNDGRFEEFARLGLEQLDLLEDEQVFKEFLQILFSDVEVQIAQEALVDVVGLDDLLHNSSRPEEHVGAAQVVDQLVAEGHLFPDLGQDGLEGRLYLLRPLLPAVDHDHRHLLVGLHETLILSLEPHYRIPVVFPELLESRV